MILLRAGRRLAQTLSSEYLENWMMNCPISVPRKGCERGAGCRPFHSQPTARKERPLLVLSRRQDERIIIDDHIVITIVEIRGDTVRLGIDAPRDIPVHREEVYEAIQRTKAEPLTPRPRNEPGQIGLAPEGRAQLRPFTQSDRVPRGRGRR